MAEQHIYFHLDARPKPPKLPLYVGINHDGLSPVESIKYSRDGTNWANIRTGGFDNGNAYGLAYYSSMWVAVGKSSSPLSTIQYSRNGSNWTAVNSSGFNYNCGNGVAYGSTVHGSTLWVAVGSDNLRSSIKYSSNGSNWSNSFSGGFSNILNQFGGISIYGTGNRVAYGNGLMVAVGSGNSSTNSILYSGDGSNWSNSVAGGFNIGNAGQIYFGNDIAYNNKLWVAVGEGTSPETSILFSTNGSNWASSITGGFNSNYGTHIAYGNGLWVAIGKSDSIENSLLYGDGSNWSNATGVVVVPTRVTFTQTAKLVKNKYVYSNLWIAYSPTRTQYSTNGSNWTYKANNYVSYVIKA